ncbi:unnamed protein product [Brachionus calyciflorus]|uniref:Nuclear receptor domain-containing protein n=1 Tax=Brachionus calyciflorus TaxID=104777 RepID=A0A813SF83_9BILA|nr:unnamed protein product [Brachionus calyciflorus]
MNCYEPTKRIEPSYNHQYYQFYESDQRQQYQANQDLNNQQQQHQSYEYTNTYELNLNPNDLQIDVESFVANLPSLEESDTHSNNQYVYQTELVTLTPDTQYQFQYQNTDSSIPISKVEILNQIIHTTTSNSSNYSTSSSYSSFSSTSNSSIEQYQDLNQSPKKKSLKTKIKRKDDKICCNVCGFKSSGFHYGSYTCEACKLFFRRTEKQIRKTGFNECKTKNCQINIETRANCSECRYKKCIAVGMGMSRSRFGRHTTQAGSNYAPNISESLCSLITNLKQTCLKSKIDFSILNNLIVDFYRKTIKLLQSSNSIEEEITNLEFSLQVDSPLSELSYLINQNKPSLVKLPDCVLVLFCVLFDINISSADKRIQNTIIEFNYYLQMTEEKILKTNQFVLILKIGLFFKVLRHLLTQNNPSVLKDDPFDKRITDLMRSEFAMFKFESDDSSMTSLSPSTSSTCSSTNSSQSESNGQSPILASLFLEINQLLYRNMTFDEFKSFMLDFEFD